MFKLAALGSRFCLFVKTQLDEHEFRRLFTNRIKQ